MYHNIKASFYGLIAAFLRENGFNKAKNGLNLAIIAFNPNRIQL